MSTPVSLGVSGTCNPDTTCCRAKLLGRRTAQMLPNQCQFLYVLKVDYLPSNLKAWRWGRMRAYVVPIIHSNKGHGTRPVIYTSPTPCNELVRNGHGANPNQHSVRHFKRENDENKDKEAQDNFKDR